MNGYAVQQSTANQPLVFLLIASSDHISGATGKSPTVTISKNGAAFASPAGAVTEVANGWYQVAANAADSATLGPLALHATATGCDPADWLFNVVAYNPQSATNLGLSALPTANPAAAGGLPTADASNGVKLSVGTGAGQLNVASGKAPATMGATDYTGNTVQTGDAFARIGATGSGLTSLAPAATALSSAQWTNTRAANLDDLDATVSSRLATAGYTAPDNANIGATHTLLFGLLAADPTQFSVHALALAPTGGGGGSVTVAGYAVGQDPATYILATPANKLATDATGAAAANVTEWGGKPIVAAAIDGVPVVDVHYSAGQATVATAQAGTSTTITLSADEPAVDNLLANQYVGIVGGTGAGQARLISGYAGLGRVATVSRPWDEAPDSTSVYAIGGLGEVATVAGPVTLDMTQAVPISNTVQTVGDALNAARAQGFGRWAIVGTQLTLYAADGTTAIRSFTLDSAVAPTSRS